jgi:hypothetical protein
VTASEHDRELVPEALDERHGLKVSRSSWGPEDEIGRLNWLTPESNRAILEHLDAQHVFDLNVEYFFGMPSWQAAADPAYSIVMTHRPQGSVNDNLSGAGAAAHERYSYCDDAIHMYTHCGTHIDTLSHLGHNGMFWNGWTPESDLGSRVWLRAVRRSTRRSSRAASCSTSPRCTASTACPRITSSRRAICRLAFPSRASSCAARTWC